MVKLRLARNVLFAALFAQFLAACVASSLPYRQAKPSPQESVLIDDGKCCIAAIAGQEISIQASFHTTTSPTEMRTMAGFRAFDETDLSESPWEPFAPTKVFTYVAPINWTGFFVTVQFRDASGTLSAIYSDDISVEGMPAAYPLSTP